MQPGFSTVILTLALAVSTGACSSKDTRFGSEPDDSASDSSTADAASWGAGSMMLRKNQKIRPMNDFQFYFKHCSQNDDRSFYSKTSYWCNEPF